MKPYIGIVHKDQDSAYGITFPDAPGCFSAADDLDNVFVAAEQALTSWMEAMRDARLGVPPPRKLSEIKVDPGWLESLETSDFLIAIPAPAQQGRREAA